MSNLLERSREWCHAAETVCDDLGDNDNTVEMDHVIAARATVYALLSIATALQAVAESFETAVSGGKWPSI